MYYQEDIETMDSQDMKILQLEKLRKLIGDTALKIDFYKNSFASHGVSVQDLSSLDDITKFPFTTKQDMREAYPFKMFAVDRDEVVRVHCSSGTTGTATVVGYTQKDIDDWADCFARCLVMAGGSAKSMVQVSYGYGLFTGGLGAHHGAHRLGASVLPTSSGNTKRQIQLMNDFGTDILCCTPSYALLIADTAIAMGLNPANDFNLSYGILGAEPFSEGMRREIEAKLGIKVLDIYGLSEIMGPGVSCECEYGNGLHINEDHFLIEIIDPVTLQPVKDGEYGEVVFTTLSKQCSPLVRYRTRDISRIIPGECACGRTHRRMDRISGRSDDMLIIRGVNVFPSQIEEVISTFEEVTMYYQIVLSTKGALDHVELLIEPTQDFAFDEVRKIEDLKRRIAGELKSNLQVSVAIRIVESKSIARSEGKAVRVIDNRVK